MRRLPDWIAALAAGYMFEVHMLRQSLDRMMALVTAPLMTLVFLSITRHAGRNDLALYAVLAPALIALWAVALNIAGEIITGERENGSLEALVATPTALGAVVTGRIAAITLVGLLGFAESWLAAWLVFGVVVTIWHPVLFAATIVGTALAMAGTASMMSALFVLARSARTFQNSLSYPFYVLGGVMVPVSFLPGWLEPVSRAVFLSWSSDLLRDTLRPAAVEQPLPRLGMIVLLATVGYAGGSALLRRALDRLRRTGTLSHA